MEIEIEVIGKPNKWVVNQSPIRIGRGAACEVNLPARQFPSVGNVHAELEIMNGNLRLKGRDSERGDLYLNDQAVEAGAFILSGDILRLGAKGPELKIAFGQRSSPRQAHEATRVIPLDELPGREPTRLMSARGETAEAPMQSSGGWANRPHTPPQAPSSFTPPVAPADRRPEPWKPAAVPQRPAVAEVAAPSPVQESKMRSMQIMQGISLGIMLILAGWIFMLNRQISQNHDEIRALRVQNQDAVGQLTPALDARLNTFSQRVDAMDGMMKADEDRMERGLDAKMKAAQDQLFANLDARMKQTEDHMVNRMNADLPPLLDKYINAKLGEIKR